MSITSKDINRLRDKLCCIIENTSSLAQIVTLLQASQDYEAKLVIDDNGAGTTYLEVRIWNADTQTWEAPLYYLPGSNTGVPVGSLVSPIIYINNSQVLANIYTELQSIDNKIITDNDDNVIVEGQTLPLSIVELYGHWDGAWQRITTDGSNNLGVAVNSSVLPTGAATETTVSTLATPVTGLATSLTRVVGAGAASVTAGKRRVSFFNAGNADASVSGGTLEKGEIVTFSADGLRDVLASISYDALTSELVITTVG